MVNSIRNPKDLKRANLLPGDLITIEYYDNREGYVKDCGAFSGEVVSLEHSLGVYFFRPVLNKEQMIPWVRLGHIAVRERLAIATD